MKVYTKKGDYGMTATLAGEMVSKSDDRIELQGSIDEINAHIGLIRSKVSGSDLSVKGDLDAVLEELQYNLYLIGVDISSKFTKNLISEKNYTWLELKIDEMVAIIPQQIAFIHYSGCELACLSHIARTVVRRCERVFVSVIDTKNPPADYIYINRLSDFIYILARYFNHLHGIEDEWMNLRNS